MRLASLLLHALCVACACCYTCSPSAAAVLSSRARGGGAVRIRNAPPLAADAPIGIAGANAVWLATGAAAAAGSTGSSGSVGSASGSFVECLSLAASAARQAAAARHMDFFELSSLEFQVLDVEQSEIQAAAIFEVNGTSQMVVGNSIFAWDSADFSWRLQQSLKDSGYAAVAKDFLSFSFGGNDYLLRVVDEDAGNNTVLFKHNRTATPHQWVPSQVFVQDSQNLYRSRAAALSTAGSSQLLLIAGESGLFQWEWNGTAFGSKTHLTSSQALSSVVAFDLPSGERVAAASSETGPAMLFFFNGSSFELNSTLPGSSFVRATDMLLVQISSVELSLIVVDAEDNASSVFLWDQSAQTFNQPQRLATNGAKQAASFVSSDGIPYLLFTTTSSGGRAPALYRWNNFVQEFNWVSDYVVGSDVVAAGSVDGAPHILVLSNGTGVGSLFA